MIEFVFFACAVVGLTSLAVVLRWVADTFLLPDGDPSTPIAALALVMLIACVGGGVWASSVESGHNVHPDAVSWRAPATLDEARALMKDHAEYVQHTRDGKDWMLSGPAQIPGHYTGIGHVENVGQMCLYVTPSGVFAGNDYYDGSRFTRSTGPCHDQVPTKGVYKLNADGSWSTVGAS